VSRSARRAAFGALLGLIGCSVYDASLLVGGLGTSGTGAQGNGGDGGSSRGGKSGGTSGNGATSGSSATGSGGSNGGSDPNGGSGASGGSSNGGSTGGSSTGGGSTGGSTGGTDTSTGGGSEGGNAGESEGQGGAADGGTTSTGGGSGSAGVGGSASGMSGTGGTGGSSGGAGSGGAGSGGAGAGGSAGAATASGCAALSAGLAATTDNTHYVVTLGNSDLDFTNAVIDVHLYAKGTGGGLFLYLQEATYEFWGQPLVSFGTFDGWTTLHWDLSAETSTGTLNKATVRRLGIEITGQGGSAWTNPTLVYVDSITVTTPALSFTFGDAATVNKTPTALHTGDTALWLNNSSSDTTATGSTLDWVTSCP